MRNKWKHKVNKKAIFDAVFLTYCIGYVIYLVVSYC